MERRGNHEIFNCFVRSLSHLFEEDSILIDGKVGRKESVSARLARHLEKEFPSYYVDIAIDGVDVMVWDRKETIVLAIFWERKYLGTNGRDKAVSFHEERKPALTLAFSLLEAKNYILLYHFSLRNVEYIHIYPSSGFDWRLKKTSSIEDEKNELQLLLNLRGKAGRKPRTKKEQTQEEVTKP